MSLTEDLLERDGALIPECRFCRREISENQLRHSGRICSPCRKAKHEGRLSARLASMGRPEPAKVPARPSLGVGVRVEVQCYPPVRGQVIRKERDGWMVWTEVGDYLRFWSGELRALPRTATGETVTLPAVVMEEGE